MVQRIHQHLLKYALFKIVVIGALLEVGKPHVFVWIIWFIIVSALSVLMQLAVDRMNRLATPDILSASNARIVGSFLMVFIANLMAAVGFAWLYWSRGIQWVLLLTFDVRGRAADARWPGLVTGRARMAQCFLLLLDGLRSAVKYGAMLYDLRAHDSWESRYEWAGCADAAADVAGDVMHLLHYAHIIVSGLLPVGPARCACAPPYG